ncbi:hypothetical protein HPULCUR_011291 [Helicostylum pulchrum]|uniref:Phosphodiest-domain-containing protein n=1 Tax=Helicostylum pulchrum TaxID=562976 RepID=A0ABP9YFN4_9FUNG
MSRSPKLTKTDCSLSLRTRKSNQDFRVLVAESAGRKAGSPLAMDEQNYHSGTEAVPEENQGLLSQVIEMGIAEEQWSPSKTKSSFKRPLFSVGLLVIFVLGCFIVATKVVVGELDDVLVKRDTLYYNGSAHFDSTVIYISLDGFRNDYLDRKVTPNIDLLAEQGIRAEYMNPSFPSITFPNHWTLVTGLYPEAHGIVANEFFDPALQQEFIHKNSAISGEPKWWGGEPIWVTSKKQGQKSAVVMWPGSNVPIDSVEPDYYIPYTRSTTAIDKMDLALNWLDLPIEQRPQSISIYIPQIDQKGHGGGPDGKQLNSVLSDMDDAIGHLMKGLTTRNLDSHVHLVVVSDHGMAATDKSRLIFYDHILSKESESFLRDREAWPLLGLRPKQNAPDYALDQIYNEVQQYVQQNQPVPFQVFKRDEMPARFHYDATDRIAPILLIPDVGYSIIRSTDYDINSGLDYRPRGIHGYDNLALEMRAIFTARGPQVEKHYSAGTVVEPFFNTEMYRFLTTLLDLEAAPNNSTLNGVFKVQQEK